MIGFLAFSLLVALVVYLHFALAHRTWRKLAARTADEIDLSYSRMEDYFGQSFRRKLGEWLQLPEAPDSTPQLRAIDRGSERILAMGPSACPPGRLSSNVLAVHGDFRAGENCHFTREVYVAGNCRIGDGTRLQALAVDGSLELGGNVVVCRWVDVRGAVSVGRDSRVNSRLTSQKSVALHPGSRVLSVFAQEISTFSRTDDPIVSFHRPADAIELPPLVRPDALRPAHGFHPRLLRQIGSETWLYRGDLILSAPLLLRAKLIVHGDCVLARGSYLEDDLKATGSVRVGVGSLCRGAVVADRDIVLESDVLFQGIVHAGTRLLLQAGVRGRGDSAVAASAGEHLFVESNVVVHGKLAAGIQVIALPPGYSAPMDV